MNHGSQAMSLDSHAMSRGSQAMSSVSQATNLDSQATSLGNQTTIYANLPTNNANLPTNNGNLQTSNGNLPMSSANLIATLDNLPTNNALHTNLGNQPPTLAGTTSTTGTVDRTPSNTVARMLQRTGGDAMSAMALLSGTQSKKMKRCSDGITLK